MALLGFHISKRFTCHVDAYLFILSSGDLLFWSKVNVKLSYKACNIFNKGLQTYLVNKLSDILGIVWDFTPFLNLWKMYFHHYERKRTGPLNKIKVSLVLSRESERERLLRVQWLFTQWAFMTSFTPQWSCNYWQKCASLIKYLHACAFSVWKSVTFCPEDNITVYWKSDLTPTKNCAFRSCNYFLSMCLYLYNHINYGSYFLYKKIISLIAT